MLTPAMSASSTSAPAVIRRKAFCTHVSLPPFLKWLPLADETTAGLTPCMISAGARPKSLSFAVSARPTAAPPRRKSRRLIFSLICLPHILTLDGQRYFFDHRRTDAAVVLYTIEAL